MDGSSVPEECAPQQPLEHNSSSSSRMEGEKEESHESEHVERESEKEVEQASAPATAVPSEPKQTKPDSAAQTSASPTPSMGHSRIYQALNPQMLWAETEEEKQKRLAKKSRVDSVGTGSSTRAAAL